jgi:hypothetical protein
MLLKQQGAKSLNINAVCNSLHLKVCTARVRSDPNGLFTPH